MNSKRPIVGAKILTTQVHAQTKLPRAFPLEKPTARRILRLTLTTLVAGCVPNVSWLPDSSGFVFTTAQGALVHYDVKVPEFMHLTWAVVVGVILIGAAVMVWTFVLPAWRGPD